MNALVNSIPPEVLHELFFGEPQPPEFPALRGWYHTGRRWKRETQGRADRNARRRYRAEMLWYYTTLKDTRMQMRGSGGRWTSRTGWCVTKEELIENNGILMGCKSCGSPFSTNRWCKPIPQELTERHLCFHCNHWLHTVIPKRDDLGTCIVGHVFYSFDHARPVVPHSPWLGHAGRTFGIQFNDGRLVTTNNLWCGGNIPELFRGALPNNARFV